MTEENKQFISMMEASKLCSYSQEYLSLLARRGKIFSKKIGRNWYTTREAIDEYLKQQSVIISLPKKIFATALGGAPLKAVAQTISAAQALTPEEPEEATQMKGGHEGHSRIFEEFERLNPQIVLPKPPLAEKEIFAPPQAGSTKNLPQAKVPTVLLRPFVSEQSGSRSSDISFAARPQSELSLPDKKEISQNVVLEKLDKLSDSLTTFAGQITQKINEPSAPAQPQNLNEEQQEFIAVQSRSLFYRLKKFNIFAKQSLRSPAKMMAVMVSAIVLLFILAGGFSFGQVDYVVQQVKKAFKDADTVQGHFPGTHANEVLVLDKAGNISIFGHIETQGQLRSHAPDGVAPITVDSVTKVENLNSDYLDGLDSKDFTLAFVTKNGNITYEDVFLEGTVEVGKTLTVKGATKLLDSLTVYGALGVFSDAVFGKNVTLTKGNLVLEKGTIQIFNQSLIKNLNAEFLDGVRKGDISLDFVTSNGSSTGNSITVGGLRVKGESNFDAQAFFNQGLWGLSGSFGSLGVAGDVSIGDPDNSDSKFEVYSKKFSVDSDGNTNIKGTGTIANLKVGGKVLSDLIPSGSFDLGSSTNRWQNVFAVNGLFTGNVTISGSMNFEGTASSSFKINMDNTSSDSEDAYLSFERGAITPNATLKWNSTANRFEFNEPVRVASSSFTAWGDITLGSVSANTLTINSSTASIPNNLNFDGNTLFLDAANNRVGVLTNAPSTVFEVQGTSSASYGLFGALQVADFSSTSYSRFGANTTSYSGVLSSANDLLISGNLEVDSDVFFDTNASVSGNFEISGNLIAANLGFINASVSNNFEVGGVIKASDGTATAPSYTFSNDENTGFFRIGDDRLGATANGILQLAIGSTGASLSNNFEITGTASISGNFNTYGTNTFAGTGSHTAAGEWNFDSNSLVIDAGTNNVGIGTSAPGSLLDVNSKFNVLSGGNVGIGTTSPATKFEVQGTASASNLFTVGSLQVGTGGATATVSYNRFGSSATTHSNYISVNNDLLVSGDLEGRGSISFAGTASLSNTLWVSPGGYSGNVGIGTSAPDNALDVRTGAIAIAAGNGVRFYNSARDGWGEISFDEVLDILTVQRSFAPAGDNAYDLGLSSNRWRDLWLSRDALISGNVGIGTTSPATKFEVQGTASASNLFTVGSLQIGAGAATATVSYNRFGTAVTTHAGSIAANNDLLISGDLEVNGSVAFDGPVVMSGGTSISGDFSVSGVIKASDGSALAPSYTFTNDIDTGLFRVGTNNIGVTTGGVLRFNLNDTGASSSVTFESTSIIKATTYTGDGAVTLLSGGANTLRIDAGGAGALNIGDVSATSIGIARTGVLTTFNGNITGPASLLTVTGNLDASAHIKAGDELIVTNAAQFGGTATVAYSRFGTGATGHSLLTSDDVLITGDLEVDGTAYFDASTLIALNASVSGIFEASSIKTDTISNSTGTLTINAFTLGGAITGNNQNITGLGNVGIGTTGPATKLEVQGTASASNLFTVGSLQIGSGGATATVSYNRFGSADTSHSNYISANNDLLISGDLEVDASAAFDSHVVIGDATDGTDLLKINSQINSNLIPNGSTRDIGSGANRWNNGYFTTLDVTTLSVASTSISGTNNNTFTINADNATADTEDAFLVFERGTSTPNSQLKWDSTNKRFDFNFPVFVQNTNTGDASNNYTKLTLKAGNTQGVNDYFEIQNGNGSRLFLVEPGGNLIASGAFQAGGLTVASASYSRLGTATTTHAGSVATANDLLISGDLEVDGSAAFDGFALFGGNASVSGNIEVGNSVFFANSTTGNVGIGTASPASKLEVSGGRLEVQGTASASYGLFGSLQVAGFSSQSYSRFGTNTTGHSTDGFSTTAAQNLLLSGALEVDSYAFFDSTVSASGNIEGVTIKATTYTGDGAVTLLSGGSNTLRIDAGGAAALNIGDVNASSLTLSRTTIVTVLNDDLRVIGNDIQDSASNARITFATGYTDFNDDIELSGNDIRDSSGTNRISFSTTGATGLTALTGFASVSQDFESAGKIIGAGVLQIGGADPVAYSRFGTGTTSESHYISSANDLLISGDLEVDGSVSFAGPASISNTLYISTLGNTGNVGIGTTVPGYLFDARKNSASSVMNTVASLFQINSGGAGANNIGSRIEFGGETTTEGTADVAAAIGGLLTTATAGAVDGELAFYTRTGGASFVEQMRIDKNGNVGIGSTVPTTKLDIAGSASVSTNFEVSGTASISAFKLPSTAGGTLGDCDAAGDTLNWDATTGKFVCGTDASASGSGVASNSLDFDEFVNAMTLDANLTIASAGFSIDLLKTNFEAGGTASIGNTVFIQKNNGNVGIGTTNPGRKLDIQAASGTVPLFVYQAAAYTGTPTLVAFRAGLATASSSVGIIGVYSGTKEMYIKGADGLALTVGETGVGDLGVYIASVSGNVGIGATSPEQKLNVGGNIIASSSIDTELILQSLGTGTNEGKFSIVASGAAGVDSLFIRNGTSETNLVTIASTGNVGIGNITPNQKFDVSGNILASSSAGVNMTLNANGTNPSSSFDFLENNTVGSRIEYDGVLNGLNFEDYSTGLKIMTVLRTGNVGIGATVPTTRLEVQGTASASNLFTVGSLQVGTGGATATVSYNRFGSSATTHSNYISVNNDLLVSGDLEVLGTSSFKTASMSTVFGSAFPTNGTNGCSGATADKLLWNSATNKFTCGADQSGGGGGSGLIEVRELGVYDDTTVASLSFDPGKFALSASGSFDTIINLDWGVGGPASLSQNETVTGNWTFSGGASFSSNLELLNTARLGINSGGATETALEVGGTASISTLYMSDGTAAVPSYTFSNDIDTGLFRAGANQLGFTTNAIQRMALDANGNLGIGTTSPTTKFEVQGTASASNLFTVGSIQVGSGGAAATVSYNRFGSAATTHAGSITANNDLLISGDLEVDGSAAFDGFALFGGNASVSGILEPASIKTDTISNSTGTLTINAFTLGGAITGNNQNITGLGNVGIGTTTPATRLEVQGTASASYGLFGSLQVAGFSSTSYSRFGTNTTGHALSAASDLLISGLLEIDGQTFFDSNASISGTLEGVTIKATTYTGDGAVTLLSGGSNTLRLDAGGAAAINIGDTSATSLTLSRTTIVTVLNDDLRVIGNDIQDSASIPRITFATGYTDFNDDIEVSGNDIRDSVGTNRISFSTTGATGLTALTGFASVSQDFESAGKIIGSSILQVGGTISTSSYSRFGTGMTTYTSELNAANDLLISGSLEVDGNAFFDANASISGNLEVTGTVTGGSIIYSTASISNNFEVGGVIKASDGSAVLPSYTFSSDENTGLFRINTDQIGFTTNGVEKMRIDANGNVGIGTTSPASKLEVSGGRLEVQGTASASYGLFGSLQVAGFSSTSYSRFGTNTTTESHYISSANDLLISGDLEVDGSVSFAGPASISSTLFVSTLGKTGNVGIGTSAPGAYLNLVNDSSRDLDILLNNGTAQGIFEVQTNDVVRLGTTTNNSFEFVTNNTTRFKVTNGGNIGINKSSPVTRFEVRGTASASNLFTVGSLQIGTGGATATVSYNRFGTSATTHSNYISANNDLLISGDIEIIGTSSFTTASMSTVFGSAFPTSGVNGCSDATSDKLLWSSTTKRFTCGTDQGGSGGGGSGLIQVRELGIYNDTTVASLSFDPGKFALSASDSFDTIINLDWGVGGPASLSQNEIVTGLWNFSGASTQFAGIELAGFASVSAGANNLNFNLDSTGDFNVQDAGVTFATFADTGIFTLDNLRFDGNTIDTTSGDLTIDAFTNLVSFSANASVSGTLEGAGTIKATTYTGDGAVTLLSGGANTLRLDAGGAGALNIGDVNATSIGIARTGVLTTFNGNITGPASLLTVTGNLDATGHIKSGDELIITNAGQFGGTATVAYSRFGTSAVTGSAANWITASNDVLVSGDLYGIGSIAFQGPASLSNTLWVSPGGYSGNVGIGTSAPGAYLNLVNDSSRDLDILLNNGTAQGIFEVQTNDVVRLGTTTNNSFEFVTNNTTRFTVTNGGNVGIGTTSPAAKLDVVSDVIFREVLQVAGTATVSYSRFGTGATSHTNWISTAGDLFLSNDLEGIGSLSFAGPASLSNTLWVSPGGSSGNVGIGTTVPATTLDVLGNASVSGSFELGSSASKLGINAGGLIDTTLEVGGTASVSGNSWFGSNASVSNTLESSALKTDTISNSTGTLTINAFTLGGAITGNNQNITGLGNVGIGTTSPLTRFEVQGTASASNLFTVGSLQVGTGGATATVSYNRFGSSATTHSNYISANNDLLVSGDLEGRGSISFAGTASLSNTLWVSPGGFSGNVGIGISTPVSPFHIQSSHTFPSFRLHNLTDGGEAGIRLKSYEGANSMHADIFADATGSETGRIGIRVPYTNEVLSILSTGNVGIGTTSPDQLLELSSATTQFIIRSTTATASTSMIFQPSGGASSSNQGKFTIEVGGTGTTSESMRFENADNIPLVRISSAGQMFIGIATEGNINPKLSLKSKGENKIAFVIEESGSSQRSVDMGEFTGYGFLRLYDGSGNISVNLLGSTNSYFNAGNVGIGSTVPSQKLDVVGTITATDITCSNCLGQNDIADASIGTGELKTATTSTAASTATVLVMNDYSFFPNVEKDDCVASAGTPDLQYTGTNVTDDTIGRFKITAVCSSGTWDVRWRYITSSDRPTVWLIANEDGTISAVWEGEDPVAQTKYPENPNPFEGTELKIGQQFVNVMPLSVDQLKTIYNNLPVGDNIAIMGMLREYLVTKRNWLMSFNSLDDIAGITERYEPAARFWAMRFVAQYYGISHADFITVLRVSNGNLVVPNQPYLVLQNYLTQRTANLAINKANRQQENTLDPALKKADIAEWYGVHQAQSVQVPEAGDLIALDSADPAKPAFVMKAVGQNNSKIIGVMSMSPNQTIGTWNDKSDIAVAAIGRVPIKVSLENGPIVVGDRLTSSSIPGVAKKATGAGMTVGMAMESLDSIASGSYQKILVFMNIGYWAPDVAIVAQAVASSNQQVVVTNGIGAGDVLSALADAVMTRVQSLWAAGDIIAEGAKKTYFAVAGLAAAEFQGVDIGAMVSNWLSRDISISQDADLATMGTIAGPGAQAAEQSKVDLAENGAYLATYGVDSTRGEVQLSGSSAITGGEAKIFFDYSFSSIISDQIPLKVFITPTTSVQGQLFVANKTIYGFVVKSINGSGEAKFDWLAIARRKGFEGNDLQREPLQSGTPTPSISPAVSETPTPSPTISETPTPMPTPTETPTPTPTPTPSVSETPTPTPIVSETPTPTPAPSETPTPTPAPSDTPTPSPMPSESPTPTPSDSPTPTPVPSDTPMPTPSETPMPTP